MIGVPQKTIRPMRIGVISDTHGLFDSELHRHFAGVDHILHAGDIGDREVIRQLERIAPVTAVSGNVDGFGRSGLPIEQVIELAGRRVALRHVVYEGQVLSPSAQAFLDRSRPDLCVFGHTHRPQMEWRGRMLLFNPGSAGPKRFTLPRVIGVLSLLPNRIVCEHIHLADRAAGPRFQAGGPRRSVRRAAGCAGRRQVS